MAMSNHSDNAVENTVLSGDEEVSICYFDLLSFDDFLEKKNQGENFFWLPFKNKVADENFHFRFSYFVFRRYPDEFFLSKISSNESRSK